MTVNIWRERENKKYKDKEETQRDTEAIH